MQKIRFPRLLAIALHTVGLPCVLVLALASLPACGTDPIAPGSTSGGDGGGDGAGGDGAGGDGGGDGGDGGGGGDGGDGGAGVDCDETPDHPDCDSPVDDIDGDTILDRDEGNCAVDSDFDRTPDCEDTDSDGDGIPDRTEAGDLETLTPPVDTDGDLIPDFRDLDSDNDGIPDAVEGAEDVDDDGKGNWIDLDSDGDLIRDAVEGTDDFDGDTIPDFLDTDSDDDTVPDRYESFSDIDGDGTPDRFESDSDDDGVSDHVEAGDSDLATLPVDTDGDGVADFQDIDSDGDGLTDRSETGCPTSTDRLDWDSDDDTFSDLAEIAVASDPCNPLWGVFDEVEFFFILPPEVVESAPLEFSTDVQQGDVHFNMDTTGSMSGEIGQLRTGIRNNIIPAVGDVIPSTAFGVSSFRDFPVGGFGSSGDYPFRLNQRVTTRSTDAQSGADELSAGGGADGPESGWESLFQIASGAGGVSWSGGSIGAFNPASERIVDVADGTIGGVGFREGSLPIVVHITDAVSHSASDYGGNVSGEHSRAQAVSSLNDIRARVIGIASGSAVRAELRNLAVDTGAVIPPCAFDGACGAGQCCTGQSGAAESPAGGVCPLVFNVNSSGSGLSDRIVDGIEFLVTGASIEVTTRVVRDEAVFAAESVDTSCFITGVVPNRADAADTCAGVPTQHDTSGDGQLDTFRNVTPGTQVFFDVVAENDGCFTPTEEPRAFEATIEVVGDGVTVLDSLRVTVIIPPVTLEGDKG